jgi:hypothetical protein
MIHAVIFLDTTLYSAYVQLKFSVLDQQHEVRACLLLLDLHSQTNSSPIKEQHVTVADV